VRVCSAIVFSDLVLHQHSVTTELPGEQRENFYSASMGMFIIITEICFHRNYGRGKIDNILDIFDNAIYKHVISSRFLRLQASLHELVIDESDPGPARLILYTNLPITCQGVKRTNEPHTCWIQFAITSSDDIAMRQRLPHDVATAASKPKNLCTYRFDDDDWKPSEGYAYNSKRSLDIVAKVDFDIH